MVATARSPAKCIARVCLLAGAACSGAGCQVRPELLTARSLRAGNEEVIQLTLRSQDAKKIKNRQLYFYLLVTECEGTRDLYAADPYIGGQRAVEFRFATSGASVTVVGRVPADVFDR